MLLRKITASTYIVRPLHLFFFAVLLSVHSPALAVVTATATPTHTHGAWYRWMQTASPSRTPMYFRKWMMTASPSATPISFRQWIETAGPSADRTSMVPVFKTMAAIFSQTPTFTPTINRTPVLTATQTAIPIEDLKGPWGLNLRSNEGTVYLVWNEPHFGAFTHPSGYKIYRADGSDGLFSLVGTVPYEFANRSHGKVSYMDSPGPGAWCYHVTAYMADPPSESDPGNDACLEIEAPFTDTFTITPTYTSPPTATFTRTPVLLSTSTRTSTPTPTSTVRTTSTFTATITPTLTPSLTPAPTAAPVVLTQKVKALALSGGSQTGPPQCLNQAVVAETYNVNLSGAQMIDSYDSALGAYGPSNHSSYAIVQAAGTIQNSAGCTIDGTQINNTAAGYTPVPTPSSYTNLGAYYVAPGSSVTLNAGNYVASSLTIDSNSTFTANGTVYLWVDSTMILRGLIRTVSGKPADLWFLGTSNCLQVDNDTNTTITGVIFAPAAQINLSGGSAGTISQLFGAVVGSTTGLSGSFQVHYDVELSCNKATATFTPTHTFTHTPTSTVTFTPTISPTFTLTRTNTPTNSPTKVDTATSTATFTATQTATNTLTALNTNTLTASNTATNTSSNTVTSTPTQSPTNSMTLTGTSTPTFSVTPTATGTSTVTQTASGTGTSTATSSNTVTDSVTNTPTDTPTATDTPSSTASSSATSTNSGTFTATASGTSSGTNTSTATCTDTSTNTTTATSTDTSTSTNSSTDTSTDSATDTATQTSSNTATASSTDTSTDTSTNTLTNTSTDSPTATSTQTSTDTSTDTSTSTNSPTDTSTDSATQTATDTSTDTSTDTDTPSDTATDTSTDSATGTSTVTSTDSPTNTSTDTPSDTPTDSATSTASETPTNTLTNSATNTNTSTPTVTSTPTIASSPCVTFGVSWSGSMNGPTGLVLGTDGNVYVLNAGSAQVQVFTQNGVYLRQFSVPTNNPVGMVQGSDGNLYISDSGNNRVDVVSSQGASLSVIGAGVLGTTQGIAVDHSGNIYVADVTANVVREYQENGTAVAIFGTGVAGGALGQLNSPRAVAVDGQQNLYVYDYNNHRVEVFNSSAQAQTTWSLGTENVYQMKFDANGYLWIANRTNALLYVYDGEGNLKETLGSSGSGAGQMLNPSGFDFDGTGNLYLSDYGNNRVEKWYSCGNVPSPTPTETPGPSPCVTFGVNWNGSVNGPTGLVAGTDGNVYVLNSASNLVQVFTQNGVYLRQFSVPTSNPVGMVQGSDGNLYISDSNNKRVDVVSSQGVSLSVIGAGVLGTTQGIAVDHSGNIYVADVTANVVREYQENGTVVMTFGNGTGPYLGQLNSPRAVAVDGQQNLYVWDYSNDRVEEFNAGGLAVNSWPVGTENVYQMKFDANGYLWIANRTNALLYVYDGEGNLKETLGSSGSGAGQMLNPSGFDFDGTGNLYLSDYGNDRVDKWYSCGNVAPTPTPLAAGQSCQFVVNQWGSPGAGNGQFNDPTGVAIDANNNVYVVEYLNDRVQVFDANGNYERQWGGSGSGNGNFLSPRGIAYDRVSNEIFVTDTGNNRVQAFTTIGGYVTQWGSSGAGLGQFHAPIGIAVDGHENVYVADSNNNRVQKFAIDGSSPATIGTGIGSYFGQLSGPNGLAVDSAGDLYVGEAGNERISKFDGQGNFITAWGSSGTGVGQFSDPYALAVGPNNFVYVADTGNDRIETFNEDGVPLFINGSLGTGTGEFNGIEGIAVSGSGAVYATDLANQRIQMYMSCAQVTPTPGGLPDLVPSGFNTSVSGTTRNLAVSVTDNSVGPAPKGVYVSFYDGDPQNGGNLLGSVQTTQGLLQGESQSVTLSIATSVYLAGPIWVSVNDSGGITHTIPETNYANDFLNSEVVFNPPLNTATPTPITARPTPTVSSGCGNADYYFTDTFNNSSSLGNYLYYDSNWQPSTLTNLVITSGGGVLQMAAGEDNAAYMDIIPASFPTDRSSYTAEADFNYGPSGNGLFGLVYLSNPANQEQGYIFQWNGLNNRWEIEKQFGNDKYYYVYLNQINPYQNGTWVHLKVFTAGGLTNAYAISESAPGAMDGAGFQVFSDQMDNGPTTQSCSPNCGNHSATSPYTTGAAGLRAYSIQGSNVVRVANFKVYTCDYFASVPTNSPTPYPTGFITPTFTSTSTITFTRTSTISPTPTVSPTPTLTVIPGAYVARLYLGDQNYTDTRGNTWLPDQPYLSGSPNGMGYVIPGVVYGTTAPVSQTQDPTLYAATRQNPSLEYKFNVLPGQYQVTLKMVEDAFTQPGQRVFSVFAQGQPVISSLDLYQTAGLYQAYDVTFTVSVTQGPLDLTWQADLDDATICAIQVIGLQAQMTPTPTRTAVPGALDLAVNAGGPAYTGTDGKIWVADQPFSPGSFGYLYSPSQPVTDFSLPAGYPIANTSYQPLYGDWIEGPVVEYKFSVPNGLYQVNCHWAEATYDQVGQRVFNVLSQGQTLVTALDLYANVGLDKAYSLSFNDISVNNGILDLQFVTQQGSIGNAMISAIEVIGEQMGPSPTPTGTYYPPATMTFTSTVTNTSTPSLTPNQVMGLSTNTPTMTSTGTLIAATATNTVTSTLTPVPGAYVDRVEVVGPNYTDTHNDNWVTDQEYRYGSAGWLIEGQPEYTTTTIAGTTDQALFQYYREAANPASGSGPALEYRFDVPPGQYQVTLNMDDIENNQAGARVFSVTAQGVTVLNNLDLVATAGYGTAYSPTFLVNVTSGPLDLQWFASVGNATISSIQVLGLQVQPTVTPTRTAVTDVLDIPVNVGGGAFTDTNSGKQWLADQTFGTPAAGLPYDIGSYGYVQGGSAFFTTDPVGGTADQTLYQAWREGTALEYQFQVPNGLYQVDLYWNQIADAPGEYDFNVVSQDATLATGLDLAFEGAYFNAVSQSFYDVNVTDGVLDVQLNSTSSFAALAGLEVIGEQSNPTATSTQTSTMTNSPTTTNTPPPSATVTNTPTMTATAPPPLPPDAEVNFIQVITGTGTPSATPVAADQAIVTGPIQIIGTANGNFDPAPPNSGYTSGWYLTYQSVAPNSNPVTIASGTSQVTNAVLGTLDPTLLLNGTYQVDLTVVDQSGYMYPAQANILVTGNQKVGNFTLSFTDLNVPVSGLPMQVVRTYDSRNKTQGDFGVGWTLDIHNIQVQESGVMGDGYESYIQSGNVLSGGFGEILIPSTESHFVSVVLPNGKVYSFQPHFLAGGNGSADVNPGTAGLSSIDGAFDVKFEPLYATAPNCKLSPIDSSGNPMTVVYANSSPDDVPDTLTWTDEGGNDYDPERFILTDENGVQYVVNTASGLEKMTQVNGDVLSVDAAGIHWKGNQSGAKDITFTRDAQGRITSIKDPTGHYYYYTYSSGGDLASYQDPAAALKGQKDTYSYNATHGLLGINDPLGDNPIRNDYDANGRLIDSVDAYGNKISYNYDLLSNSEAVTNRNNKPTQYIYDANGNVIQETDPLGNITYYTYSTDGYNNKLTELLPGNSIPTVYQYNDPNNPRLVTKQTDPNGNSVSYTYDNLGHLLTTTDAKGNVATNTYDVHGDMLTSQSAQGIPPTTYLYDANGDITVQTDPQGIVTAYGYDNSGDQTAMTIAYGLPEQAPVAYTYDANGNRLTETKYNPAGSGSQTTVYAYDACNRLEKTTYPDSTASQTVYDSLGHTVQSIDQKNRSTLYSYDAMGRAVTVQYPDRHKMVYGYDDNGNKTDSTEYGTDGVPRNTHTDYDADNRAATVTYADGYRTYSVFYPQGWVEDSVDEDNHDTHFIYDQGGRKTTQVMGYNSLVSQETDYGYDANGNQTTLTVSGQLQSTTEYDGLNRAVTVLYPQPSGQAPVGPLVTQYDNDGRKTGQIDQAGKVTSYTYDGQSRLTFVSKQSSGGSLTENYTYDTLGNMLSQTDTNQHTTTYTYDNMNRRKSRTLPGGQQETYDLYDATGNLTQKTNFNHQTIGYGYNPLNDKLTSETYVGGSISYNYDGFLRRQSMMDTSGNTTYNYDARDRLLAKNSPFGSITYGYDHHGNLTSVASSNPNGTNVGYEYDSLNRPVTVTDSHRGVNTTTYSYDNIGNLNKEVLPNGASVTYVYDVLNRLNSMTAKVNGSQVAGYAYTLGPAGNKTQVIEDHPISGASRMVNYGYDDLYRLTNETVTNDPTYNGVVSYVYDPVGNRNARNSSLSPITTQNFSGEYDANDRLGGGYTYDSDGNTLTDSQGNNYTYDGLDRLTQVTGPSTNVQYVYDGDGNRVQVIDNTHGTTTSLLVDSNNLTGYAQVLESLQGGGVNKVYTYGTNRISEDQWTGSAWSLSYYGYDGQGSVRYLTDTNGNVTDTYDYDAFGNLVNKTGTTKNEFLYDGEHQDPSTGFYYLRARYMNPGIGRFHTMDSTEGDQDDPLSLHKYLFCANNAINLSDPTGKDFDIATLGFTTAIEATLFSNVATTLAGGAFAIANGPKPTAFDLTWSKGKSGGGLTGNASITAEYDLQKHVIKFIIGGSGGLSPFSLLAAAEKGTETLPEIGVKFGGIDQKFSYNVTAYWPINSGLVSLGLKAFGSNAQGINSVLNGLSKSGVFGSTYGSSIGISVSSDGSDTLAFPPGPTFGTLVTAQYEIADVDVDPALNALKSKTSGYFDSLNATSLTLGPAQLFSAVP